MQNSAVGTNTLLTSLTNLNQITSNLQVTTGCGPVTDKAGAEQNTGCSQFGDLVERHDFDSCDNFDDVRDVSNLDGLGLLGEDSAFVEDNTSGNSNDNECLQSEIVSILDILLQQNDNIMDVFDCGKGMSTTFDSVDLHQHTSRTEPKKQQCYTDEPTPQTTCTELECDAQSDSAARHASIKEEQQSSSLSTVSNDVTGTASPNIALHSDGVSKAVLAKALGLEPENKLMSENSKMHQGKFNM